MPDAMIAQHPKRTATGAQKRLAKADPATASLMDAWETEQNATFKAWKTQQAATFAAWETELGDAFDDAEFALVTFADEQAHADLVLGKPQVDWYTTQYQLAEERARLLLTAGKTMDQTLHLAAFGVGVARQVAGSVAAARMASTQPVQAAIEPPRPPDQFDGGDSDDDDPADTEPLRAIREHAAAPTQEVYVPAWRAHATRVAGWWRRTLRRTRRAYAHVTVSLLVAAGLAWGVG